MSLAELPAGVPARICGHDAAGPVPERLRELGFVGGTSVQVLRSAPFGDPVEVELRGYRVCLRRRDLTTLCAVPDGADA